MTAEVEHADTWVHHKQEETRTVIARRADPTDHSTAASATVLVLEVAHGEAMSAEVPPKDELVSDTGWLSDGDPGDRSELNRREDCDSTRDL